MKRRLVPVLIPLIVLLLLILALAAVLRSGTDTFASHVDEPAPATALENFATADWQGRAYLVSFFASWCAPCQAEHPILMGLSAQHLPVIGIAVKDKPEAVKTFLAKEGNPYVAVAEDSKGRTGIDWGITGMPETFLIDAEGVIRFHDPGPLTQDVVDHQLLPLWEKLKQ